MRAMTISWIAFACVFGGALLGMFLRRLLPEHHLDAESKSVVQLGMALVATMCALLLGLLIASAKGSYDAQRGEVTSMSANVVQLDRILARYGPETVEARGLIRVAVISVERNWSKAGSRSAMLDAPATRAAGADFYEQIAELKPHDDFQRSLQGQALQIALELGQTRSLLLQQAGSVIPTPFLVVLIFWLAVIFLSFGLFAPYNTTVIATLLVCALSVSAAIFLIIELDNPFNGLLQISDAPLHTALALIGR